MHPGTEPTPTTCRADRQRPGDGPDHAGRTRPGTPRRTRRHRRHAMHDLLRAYAAEPPPDRTGRDPAARPLPERHAPPPHPVSARPATDLPTAAPAPGLSEPAPHCPGWTNIANLVALARLAADTVAPGTAPICPAPVALPGDRRPPPRSARRARQRRARRPRRPAGTAGAGQPRRCALVARRLRRPLALPASLDGHQAAGDHDGEARALARLGVVEERLGDHDAALTASYQALALHRARAPVRRRRTADQPGGLHRRSAATTRRAHHGRQPAFADLGDRRLEGYALGNLGAEYSC